MSRVPTKPGVLPALTGLAHAQHTSDTRSHQNPDDIPLAPTAVDLDFRVREKQNRIDYDGIASCSGVTPNTCAADIQLYVFQMKAVKQDGSAIPQNQLDSGEDIKWTQTVLRKDASDMTTPHAVFGRVPNPKEWYFIVRARVIDRIGHLGAWSAWTAPQKPVQVADPIPPTPTGIAMNFDKVEKDRWNRFRCIASCNEITSWDIPGGDDEGDIAEYEFELRKSDDVGTPDASKGRRHSVKAKADGDNSARTVFFPVKKGLYYVLRVRSRDRFNRLGDWSAWVGPGSATDTTPPPVPVGVFAEGLFNSVSMSWDNPVDAAGDPDEDVAYFQVQRSTDRNFDNIVSKDLYVAGTRRTWPSRAYKQRFWLRVRSVDASGNKSAWVQAGPVSPQKASAGREVVAGSPPTTSDIDWRTDGIDLAGEITNRAYNVSGTSGTNLVAWVEGEFTFGTIETDVQFSPTTNRTRIGVVFHYIDANNYMYVDIEKTAATGSLVRLRKVSAGVDSQIMSSASFTFKDGQLYTLRVIIAATTVTVGVDQTNLAATGLTGADQTQYNGGTKVGVYKKRGASSDDDGGSRHENFKYTSTTAEVVVDDEFDRTPSTTTLGTADSGQGWTSQTGVWGIIDESVPTALFGYGSILPILYMEDPTERNNVQIQVGSTSAITMMGQSGINNNPLTIEIDRPTRIVCMAWGNYMNESATVDVNASFYAVVEDWDGFRYLGRQTRTYSPANDSSPAKRRLLSTVHQLFLDPQGVPSIVNFWFGYKQTGDGGTHQATIANQKMVILLSYAPDYDPSTPLTRVAWTKSSQLAKAYRGQEPDDA